VDYCLTKYRIMLLCFGCGRAWGDFDCQNTKKICKPFFTTLGVVRGGWGWEWFLLGDWACRRALLFPERGGKKNWQKNCIFAPSDTAKKQKNYKKWKQ